MQQEMFGARRSGKSSASMIDTVGHMPAKYMFMFLKFVGEMKINAWEAYRLVKQIAEQDQIIEEFESRGSSVDNKHDMYALLEAGAFGNVQVSYPIEESEEWYTERVYTYYSQGVELNPREVSFHACKNPPKHELWALRYKKPGYRQWSCYDLPAENVWPTYCDYLAEGADPKLFNLTPMMPDDKIVIQGEIKRSDQFGWTFRLSTMKRPMNISLNAEPLHVNGPGGWLILKDVMDVDSYADLQELFERFPDAVIEFSTYSVDVGKIPNRNTMVWEVRNY